MADAQSELDLGVLGEHDEAEFDVFGESEAPAGAEQYLDGILGPAGGGEVGSPLTEAEEASLAAEMLELESEEELEQFLGDLIKRASAGVRNFARSRVGRALGGVLRTAAKRALPVVGGAVGSYFLPGIGTAIGSRLGAAASNLFELDLESMPAAEAEFEAARRFVNLSAAAARHASCARPAEGVSPQTLAAAAVARAARDQAPGLHRALLRSLGAPVTASRNGHAAADLPSRTRRVQRPRSGRSRSVAEPEPEPEPEPALGDGALPNSGRWVRRGRKILLLGV